MAIWSLALMVIGFLLTHDQQVSAAVGAISTSDCAKGKGCLFMPANCDPQSGTCVSGVTYRKNADFIDFELLSRMPSDSPTATRYAAVGFSRDQNMGEDAVTYCTYNPNNDRVTVGLAYNPQKYNELITDPNLVNSQIRNASGGLLNGNLVCRFSQKIQPPTAVGASQKIFPLDTQYYLLLATGNANVDQNGTTASKLGPHVMEPESDFFPKVQGPLSLTSVAAVEVTNYTPAIWKHKLVLAHGILMVFGWMLLVAMAILFARYSKTMLGGRKILSLPYWFHLHRGLNIIGVLAIATAFVCIFVAEDGVWSGRNVPQDKWYPVVIHAIVGMTASIGAFIQPIMSLFRCGVDTPKRPIFNWFHRILGIGSWVCASAAIWLATEFMEGLQATDRYGIAPRALIIFYWVVLGLVIIGLEVWITAFERMKGRGTVSSGDIQLRTINGKHIETTTTQPTKFGFIRGLLLLFFVLVAVAVTVALACFIAMP